MPLMRLFTTFERTMSPRSEEDNVPNTDTVPEEELWHLLEDDRERYTDTLPFSAVRLHPQQLGSYRGRRRASSRWPPSRTPISLSPVPASSEDEDESWSLTSEIERAEDDEAHQPLLEELRSSTHSPSPLSIRWLPSLPGGEPSSLQMRENLAEHAEANTSMPSAPLPFAAALKEERALRSPRRSGDTPAARYAAARDSQREAELKRLSQIVEAQSTDAMAMGRRILALEEDLMRSQHTLRHILAAVEDQNQPPAYTED
ncbi:hypothetical protein CcaverHIS641_0500960 [Cutaneotrichosporon cavernicola]|nr:hypothetical protein CcaverHIS641_0500960 [Cutaneotrichosporon cavernicola]